MKEKYIQAAKNACEQVHQICPLGSTNRCNESRALAEAALIREKQNFDEQVKVILSQKGEEPSHLVIIRLLAEIAQKARAGNCQEMAAVAFLYLMEKNIRPIELVSIPTHTFVVVGRDPNTPIARPAEWNQDSVVCDPWRQEGVSAGVHRLFQHESMVYGPQQLLIYGCENIKVGFSLYESQLEPPVGQKPLIQ